jgi:hypothetical protein
MIPGDHPIVDTDDRIRQREVVVTILRDTLEHAPPVVGKEAGGAALERRQAGDHFLSMFAKERSNEGEDVPVRRT